MPQVRYRAACMATDLPLQAFSYSAPTLVHFGPGSLARLGPALKRLGVHRALLVCDARLSELDLGTRVAEASLGRVAGVWTRVEPDAPRASVEAAAEEARRLGADAIVALGGGSAMDTAKAAALLAPRGGDLARWEGVSKVEHRPLPVVAIPTTAGTGSEVSSVAVVKDDALGRKLVILDRSLHPEVALLDPTLVVPLPPGMTAATGLEALSRVIEGLVSAHRQPLGDAIGLECVRILRAWLPRANENPSDVEARGFTLLASAMAGQVVSMGPSGVAHAAANALGVGWGIHHGTASAALLPWSIRFNAGHAGAAAMYARCAAAFGVPAGKDDESTAHALADAVERFAADLGLSTRLGALGVAAGDLKRLGELAFADPSHALNPVQVKDASAFSNALQTIL